MANFCSNCGTPASGRFCAKCGTAIQEVPTQAQNPAPSASLVSQNAPMSARAGGTSSGAKIIFIVLGIVVFLGITAVGSLVYVGYRAKQKIALLKKEYGIENASNLGSSD